MNIIDFHTHVFPPEQIVRRQQLVGQDDWFGQLYGNPRMPMATADELLRVSESVGVSRSVVFGFPWQDAGLLKEGNDYVFASAERHPDRLVPFVSVHPSDSKTTERELNCPRPVPVRGIGELMPNGYSLSDIEVMRPTARFAIERGIPVLTHVSEPFGHVYPGKGRTYAQEVLDLASGFPELKIVCGHWGGGLIFYELQPELASVLSNVTYDTAASCYLYDDRVYRLGALLCPDKVVFGSDFPTCPLPRQLKAVRASVTDDDIRERILIRNAERLLAPGSASIAAND